MTDTYDRVRRRRAIWIALMPGNYDTQASSPPTTWDLATVSNVILSNGNLTATHTNTTSNSGARSIALQSTGKYYYEVTVVASHGMGDEIAIAPAATTYTNLVAAVAVDYVMVIRNTGIIFRNGVSSGKSLSPLLAGDVIGIAVDLNARLIWFRRNGGNWYVDAAANPTTGTNGVTIAGVLAYAPVVTFGGSGTVANDAFTANFGQSAYTTPAPSGFGNWTV